MNRIKTENILNRSLYEIYWRLTKISQRNNSEREFTASLHGIELEKPVQELKKLTQIVLEK